MAAPDSLPDAFPAGSKFFIEKDSYPIVVFGDTRRVGLWVSANGKFSDTQYPDMFSAEVDKVDESEFRAFVVDPSSYRPRWTYPTTQGS